MTLQEILLLFNLRLVKDERVGAGKMEQNMKASEEENSPRQQKTSDCKENYIYAIKWSITPKIAR